MSDTMLFSSENRILCIREDGSGNLVLRIDDFYFNPHKAKTKQGAIVSIRDVDDFNFELIKNEFYYLYDSKDEFHLYLIFGNTKTSKRIFDFIKRINNPDGRAKTDTI